MSCGPTGSAAHEGFFHHSWEFCGRKGGLRAIGKAFQSAACHWSQCPQGHSPLQHPPRFQTQLLLLRGLALALLTHPAMHGHLASQQAARGPSWYSSIPWSAECSREQTRPPGHRPHSKRSPFLLPHCTKHPFSSLKKTPNQPILSSPCFPALHLHFVIWKHCACLFPPGPSGREPLPPTLAFTFTVFSTISSFSL